MGNGRYLMTYVLASSYAEDLDLFRMPVTEFSQTLLRTRSSWHRFWLVG